MPDNENDAVTRANLDKRTARKIFREEFKREIHYIRQSQAAAQASPKGEVRGNIEVAVRVRPLFEQEERKGAFEMISAMSPQILVHDCRMHVDMRHMFIDTTSFGFSRVYGPSESSDLVYCESVRPMLEHTLLGHGNSTFIMYGQTGTGKTYTMSAIQDYLIEDLFRSPVILGHSTMTVCCFEIAGKKCLDLLNNKEEVFLREGEDRKIHVRGVTEFEVSSGEGLYQLIDTARAERKTSATVMNSTSSRTHSVIQLTIVCDYWEQPLVISLVDLAGSEMSGDSMYHTAEQRRECAEINTSLMALKECVRKAAEGSSGSHIPYRSHLLTKLLKECFESDRDRTLLIATVAPDPKDTEHTVNTLRSASKMGNLEDLVKIVKAEVMAHPDEAVEADLVAPIRFTPAELQKWLSSICRGSFAKFVGNLGSMADGKMFSRYNDISLRNLCGGSEKLAAQLRAQWRKAVDAEKSQKLIRQKQIREQSVRDRLAKAKAL